MKKTVISLLIIFALVIPCSAKSLNWYCCHNCEHVQPSLGSDLKLCEKYNAYYCDKSHSDWGDEKKVIYLTFDAGYENGNVAKILDTLKEKKVSGTFFILENLCVRNSDLVRRMADEGHVVANHTATHKNMSKIACKADFTAELNRLSDACTAIGVECQKFYRPPEGCFSEENLKWASEEGYKTVFWSFAYADWDNNRQMSKESAKEKILSCTHNGEIILLHPTSATNAAILGDLIDSWREMGFSFGTPDMLK